jgi:addiction module RelE/StbE family toxin
MPRIKYTQRFLRLYNKLPAAIQAKVRKQIRLLAENPRHPSLQSKPILGVQGIYEARVDKDYRFTYERDANDTLVLRVVGQHDEALKHP